MGKTTSGNTCNQDSVWEYTFPRELQQLAMVRGMIRKACRETWQEDKTEAIESFLLAIQEAGTNIIRHGYHDPEGRWIQLHIRATSEDVTVTFSYPGEPFDPSIVPNPCFDGTREGGYGIYLIKNLVNSVCYDQDESGYCRIRLHQYRVPKPKGNSRPCN